MHSSRKVTLDVEDPQKKFIENVLKGLLSILPGIGFFSKYLEKVAKLESRVCCNKERLHKGRRTDSVPIPGPNP